MNSSKEERRLDRVCRQVEEIVREIWNGNELACEHIDSDAMCAELLNDFNVTCVTDAEIIAEYKRLSNAVVGRAAIEIERNLLEGRDE